MVPADPLLPLLLFDAAGGDETGGRPPDALPVLVRGGGAVVAGRLGVAAGGLDGVVPLRTGGVLVGRAVVVAGLLVTSTALVLVDTTGGR